MLQHLLIARRLNIIEFLNRAIILVSLGIDSTSRFKNIRCVRVNLDLCYLESNISRAVLFALSHLLYLIISLYHGISRFAQVVQELLQSRSESDNSENVRNYYFLK